MHRKSFLLEMVRIYSELAGGWAGQSSAIPVFLKHGTNDWEYRGDFAVRRSSFDPVEIARHATAAGRNDVTMLVELEQIK
jgi:hypothetical protein